MASTSHLKHKKKQPTPIYTFTDGGIPVAPDGASAAVLGEAEALLESSREWIQLEAPCLKSRSSSAVSLLTRLRVLTFSTGVSVCGSLPKEGRIEQRSMLKIRCTVKVCFHFWIVWKLVFGSFCDVNK